MNSFQVAYLIALVALTYPAWSRQRHALGLLWANLLVTLFICLMMDLGVMGRNSATVSMMLVDLCTGVALALGPGLSRIIAWGYAVSVPIYLLAIFGWASTGSTYGIVYVVASAQLGALAIGSIGPRGGGWRRWVTDRFASSVPARNAAVRQGSMARSSASDRVAE